MRDGYIVRPYTPIWDIIICKGIHSFAPDEHDFIQRDADRYKENVSAMTIIKEGLIKSTRPDWRANFYAPRGKKSQEYFVYFKIF